VETSRGTVKYPVVVSTIETVAYVRCPVATAANESARRICETETMQGRATPTGGCAAQRCRREGENLGYSNE